MTIEGLGRAQVVCQASKTVQRRARLAEEFRQKLLVELPAVTTSGAREALLQSAVSSFVEISEVTATYLRGRATPRALQRLGLARSELRRCLRALGLIAAEPEGEVAPVPEPAEWLAHRPARECTSAPNAPASQAIVEEAP